MRIPSDIHDNLRFLADKVGSRVANLQSYFEFGSVSIAHPILDGGLCDIGSARESCAL